MYKKILCAVDGTESSTRCIVHAAKLAALTGAGLSICTVNEILGGMRGPLIYKHEPSDIKKLLDHAAEVAKANGVANVAEVELDGRNIPEAIVSYADTNGFDHIVTGTGDKRGVTRLVLGSVAGHIAGHAHCSVTVVR